MSQIESGLTEITDAKARYSAGVRIPANVTDDSGDRDRCWCCAM